ncbi:tRNA (guanine(10)-N(2))-dimethyltransferase [Candidatus Woesearchaeota archaeon]|nr:tRNA (guanine(10)-N(2))-dimethyltransferase [Candidatus Woesearchaeota archaeon]
MDDNMHKIREGKAEIFAPETDKISRKMPVFYNPVMELNRTISVLLLSSLQERNMQIALPLTGTGVRGIRFLLELEKNKIKYLTFNDNSKTAVSLIKKNVEINNLGKNKKIIVHNEDANLFMLKSKGFDYIDTDPFGTPVPFLDSSILRLARDGILAVTATDTAALAGSSPNACLRKYSSKPLKNEFMHETGIRILIRKIQAVGAQCEKALIPIFSYAKDHYYRVFLRCIKGRQKVDALLKNHGFILYCDKCLDRRITFNIFNHKKCISCKSEYDYAGPLWLGDLWDRELVGKMYKNCDKVDNKLVTLISLIKEESKINAVGFYDLHKVAKISKKPIPKIEKLVRDTKVARTHFLGWGVRTKELDFIQLPS